MLRILSQAHSHFYIFISEMFIQLFWWLVILYSKNSLYFVDYTFLSMQCDLQIFSPVCDLSLYLFNGAFQVIKYSASGFSLLG